MRDRTWRTVLLDHWPVKLVCVAAAVLLAIFQHLISMQEVTLAIPLQVKADYSLVPASEYPQRVRLVLRANSRDLGSLGEADFSAYVDFSGQIEPGDYQAPIIIQKHGLAETLEPLELRVEPGVLGLRLEARQRKAVVIMPDLQGSPDAGFGLEEYFFSPSTVEIEGPQSILSTINSVTTEVISLDGHRESFSLPVRLLPGHPLVRIAGSQEITFRAVIAEAVLIRSLEKVPIVVEGLSPALSARYDPPTGSLRLQGSQVILQTLAAQEARIAIDCHAITRPGVYQLPARAVVPAGLTILRILPERITVVVRAVTP